ncbi:MAG: hypothetical protein J2P54_00085 [Bradyrhizobiaceae bacterium]|nr:hypothetical protein [Bradyrhizobiaceae bacterium]
MTFWTVIPLTQQIVAEVTLVGMGFDVLGGCYLAYDLLGGKHGPLRTIARAAGYMALFFVGYYVVLGAGYALIASSGMGVLLTFEFWSASADRAKNGRRHLTIFAFGVLRGVVLGLASMPLAGPAFGTWFGLMCAATLNASYALGFAPTDSYEAKSRPHISRHKLVASLLRTLGVSAAGVIASLVVGSPSIQWPFGLLLGVAAGTVSALVGLFSPVIEWWIDNLPERRLGVFGLGLILFGMVLQSVQYWVVVLAISVP